MTHCVTPIVGMLRAQRNCSIHCSIGDFFSCPEEGKVKKKKLKNTIHFLHKIGQFGIV